jgi:hypothetical protein
MPGLVKEKIYNCGIKKSPAKRQAKKRKIFGIKKADIKSVQTVKELLFSVLLVILKIKTTAFDIFISHKTERAFDRRFDRKQVLIIHDNLG